MLLRRRAHEPTWGAATGVAPARPLASPVRAEMEQRFQHDFSRVRVHADEAAARNARALSARAFTVGEHIHFGEGRYDPGSEAGRRLLAHELTHVVQQRGSPDRVQCRPDDGAPGGGDPFEREALDHEARPWRRPGSTLSYREAQELVLPARDPAAATLPDRSVHVLPADRAMFQSLRGYLSGLPQRLAALVAAGDPDEPWLTATNPHVQSALAMLDRLNADLTGPSLVVRFDHPESAASAASYDLANNQMHLRPFSSDAERTLVAVDMVHEYTHVVQDRTAERAFARSRTPRVATAEEDLQREIDARREEVYFGELLRVLGEPVPTSALLGSQLTGRVFRGQFERARVTPATKDSRAAAAQIRKTLRGEYAAQLAVHASLKQYAVEIQADNHAVLVSGLPGKDRIDLGEMPASLASRQALASTVSTRLQALPEFRQLFTLPKGGSVTTILVSVVHGGEQLVGFALQ